MAKGNLAPASISKCCVNSPQGIKALHGRGKNFPSRENSTERPKALRRHGWEAEIASGCLDPLHRIPRLPMDSSSCTFVPETDKGKDLGQQLVTVGSTLVDSGSGFTPPNPQTANRPCRHKVDINLHDSEPDQLVYLNEIFGFI